MRKLIVRWIVWLGAAALVVGCLGEGGGRPGAAAGPEEDTGAVDTAGGGTVVADEGPADAEEDAAADAADTAATDEGCTPRGFVETIQPIFTGSCALSGCHRSPGATLGLDLGDGAAYAAIVGVDAASHDSLKRIEPGEPDDSLIYLKVSEASPPVGSRMPLIGGPLSAAQIDDIREWIEEGAPEGQWVTCPDDDTGAVADAAADDGADDATADLGADDAATDDGAGPDEGSDDGADTADTTDVAADTGDAVDAADTADDAAALDCSFEETIQPIFTNSCAFPGCHGGNSPQQGQLLTAGNAYGNIVDVEATSLAGTDRIEPGDPMASLLFRKISEDTPPVGGRMPLGGQLGDEDIAKVRRWIEANAPDGAYACDP